VATPNLKIRLDAIDNTKRAFKSAESSTSRLKKALFSLRGVLATIGAGVALRSIVNVTSNFEDLRDSLASVTGSAKSGAEAFNFIQDFALRSQFSVEDLTTSFITLKASGIQPTEKLLRVFTDTAAVTTDQLGTLEALTRVFSRGVQGGLGLEELNQIADRGVPIFRLLEEEIGLSRLEISKFGQTTDGAKKILDALEKSLGKTFTGATEQKLDNLSTAQSNLGIAFRNFQDVIGGGSFGKAISNLFNSLSELLVVIEPLGRGLGFLGGVIAKSLSFAVDALVTSFKFFGSVINELSAIVLALIKIALKPFEGIIESIGETLQKLKNVITEQVNKALDNIGDAIDFIRNAYNDLKRSLGIAVTPVIKIDKQPIEEAETKTKSLFERIKELAEATRSEVNSAFEILQTQITNINEIIAKGIVGGVRSVSQGIARSIVLGEKLSDVFRKLAQQIIIQLIAKTIEYYALKLIIKTLDETILKKDKEKVANQQRLNSQLKVELALRAAIAAFGGGGGGGGFSLPFFAEGGNIKAGQPAIVGERGRELFVPDSDGQIISNENMGTLGGASINFTINATDVKGVKELLIDNRATIVNIINGALNQKGKAALV